MAHLLLCPFLTFRTCSIIPHPFPEVSKGPLLVWPFLIMIFQHIVNQTNLYARLHPFSRVKYQWNDLTVDDLRSFFGIFIATGLELQRLL